MLDYRFYLKFPPVRQSLTDSCWAACIEWWTNVSGANSVTEATLLSRYAPGSTTGAVPGSLLERILRTECSLSSGLSMRGGGFIFAASFSPAEINKLVAEHDCPIFLGFGRPGGNHFVCAYGASTTHVAVMNPDPGILRGIPIEQIRYASLWDNNGLPTNKLLLMHLK